MHILIYMDSIDFRKGIDGFAAICYKQLGQNPYGGTLFLFKSRSETSIRILVYDGQGFWLSTKRLSAGKFHWWPSEKSEEKSITINSRDLQTLLRNGNPPQALAESIEHGKKEFVLTKYRLKTLFL